MTPVDEKNARLIGVLMMAAKLLEMARRDVPLPAEEAAVNASKGYGSLMKTALRMFPNPGEMEKEVLELGKRLGFVIEQQIVPEGAKRRQ